MKQIRATYLFNTLLIIISMAVCDLLIMVVAPTIGFGETPTQNQLVEDKKQETDGRNALLEILEEAGETELAERVRKNLPLTSFKQPDPLPQSKEKEKAEKLKRLKEKKAEMLKRLEETYGLKDVDLLIVLVFEARADMLAIAREIDSIKSETTNIYSVLSDTESIKQSIESIKGDVSSIERDVSSIKREITGSPFR